MILKFTPIRLFTRFNRLTLKAFLLSVSALTLIAPVFARQQPAASPTPAKQPAQPDINEEVLRIDTNLIQVDAIVKDKNGKVVTDLKASDFEIVEDGKSRAVDYSSFISTTETREIASPADGRLNRNEVRRTFVFVVNNPVVDFTRMYQDRDGFYNTNTTSLRSWSVRVSESTSKFLNKFIGEQMGNRDLVSIVDTEVSLGTLSNFTNNREFLQAAVKQMRSNVGDYPVAKVFVSKAGIDANQLIEQNLAVLTTAQDAVVQLQKVPGRKIVVMLSQALLYNTDIPGAERVKKKLDQLIAEANQAQVTFYYLSASGIGAQGNGAAQRLAEETGGRSIYNTNDVSIGFAEILKENDGYYQLAYDPGEDLAAQPHNITVRLKRSDLKVQSRSTVYKNAASINPANSTENLLRILRSPFGIGDVKLTVTPAYQSLAKTQGRLTVALNIDPAAIKTPPAADGLRHVKMDVALQVTGPDNRLLKQQVKVFTLKVSEESWQKIQAEGLIYNFETETNKAGYHQVNAAVCIADSKQCGSASQFINAVRTKEKREALK